MKNWVSKNLDEVCELITCGVAAKPNYVDVGVPFLSAKNVKEGQIVWSGYNCVSEQTHNELTKNNKPLVGDILYTRVGSYGEAAVIEDDFEFSVFVSLTLIKVDKSVLNNYFLKHYLNSDFVKRLAKKSISSSGVGNLNVGTVREFPILLPPLPEQQRIVAILDEAFAAIAKAKANAQLNLQNAKELFESYLQGVSENGNWETKTIQEVTKVINGYAFASKDFKSTNTIKSIKITNVGVKEFVEEADNYLPEKFKDTLKAVQVKEGNIVIALTRTIISAGLKVAVVPKSYDGALVNQRVAALVPNEKIINQRYLYNFLTTDGVAKYVLAHVNTLMQPNLSINDLKNLAVPCPSLKIQQTIVQKLDALNAETKKLESIYKQKINDLEELKKSILKKAFSGELASDEPAELKTKKTIAV
jgi:type I restriction enzyme S subunit